MMDEKILCVDDEPSVLVAFQRNLRKHFHIETAETGADALARIDAQSPYAVVVSDMRMPGMDGVQLLKEIKKRTPNTVRIMLTGNADQHTAMDAVNEGSIFRFLTKPCTPETLAKAIAAGIEQYRLITAEKELLQDTLCGSVKVLTDVLSLANPAAFGRAMRVRRLVQQLCQELKLSRPWEYEVAAMLSQIGCVTVPPSTLDKVYHGRALEGEEAQMFGAHPAVGHDLVANIPRLENVAEIIAYQQRHYDGSGPPAKAVRGDDIPHGARVLNVALDFDTLRRNNLSKNEAFAELYRCRVLYDPFILAALETVIEFDESLELREVRLYQLTAGMIFDEDVTTGDGAFLVGRGQEVTAPLLQRLRNFDQHMKKIKEPIRVLVQTDVRSPVATRAG